MGHGEIPENDRLEFWRKAVAHGNLPKIQILEKRSSAKQKGELLVFGITRDDWRHGPRVSGGLIRLAKCQGMGHYVGWVAEVLPRRRGSAEQECVISDLE